MKNLWLIQTSGFITNHINQTVDTLKDLNYEFEDFGVIPYDNKVSNLNNILRDDTQYIVRCGVYLLEILDNLDNLTDCATYIDPQNNKPEYMTALKNSLDWDEKKFDQAVYKDFDLPLLNSDAEYLTYSEAKDLKFENDMFLKPSRDLKSFCGGIMEKGLSVDEFIKGNNYRKGFEKETLIISKLQTIYTEYRFFIIDSKVITGSMYKRGQEVVFDSYIPPLMMKKAIEYAKLFAPAEIFVMDLAETDKGIVIVEYNCWNCSGLYDVDTHKLFTAVNEFKINKNL